jgi:hypothetical protein
MDVAMQELQRRTFQAWMGALCEGTKQREHSCVLRQPAWAATLEHAKAWRPKTLRRTVLLHPAALEVVVVEVVLALLGQHALREARG